MVEVVLATTENIPGYEIKKHLGLVWASTARSKHLGHDLYAVLKGLFGGEIKGYTQMSNEARSIAANALAKNAEKAGANAVVAVRFGTTQILPATIDVFAYGTAVWIEKSRK